jgi:hypothetical protein
MININGRSTAKLLIEKGLREKGDGNYYYFKKQYFKNIPKDEYFAIDGNFVKVSKNKLWAW